MNTHESVVKSPFTVEGEKNIFTGRNDYDLLQSVCTGEVHSSSTKCCHRSAQNVHAYKFQFDFKIYVNSKLRVVSDI